ncbi:hypothetical protein ACE10Z_34590 [Bradyrhizobium sp. Pha-3]|uniref:hypothetical protein n=1 Tax=Bradyrhizobium sp. Pha-3 TaxID=208375 RepID=UPI0035D3DF68
MVVLLSAIFFFIAISFLWARVTGERAVSHAALRIENCRHDPERKFFTVAAKKIRCAFVMRHSHRGRAACHLQRGDLAMPVGAADWMLRSLS